MDKNKITFRISEPDILNFVERKAKDRNITVSKFINDCIRKCKETENNEYGIQAMSNKLDKVYEQNEMLKTICAELIKYVASNYTVSAIALQGRINEFNSRNIDPYKFYDTNIDEITKKFHLLVDVTSSNNEDNK